VDAPADLQVYTVLVEIIGSTPTIWREIEVLAALPLQHVHTVLQIAFGWTGEHLHLFSQPATVISGTRLRLGAQWLDQESLDEGLDGLPETEWSLAQVLTAETGPLTYTYDFGDYWHHRITLLSTRDRGDDRFAARVLAGDLRAPLENSGGIERYTEILRILEHPGDDRYADTRAFVDNTSGPWDAPFDAGDYNIALANSAMDRHFPVAPAPGELPRWQNWLDELATQMSPQSRLQFRRYLDRHTVETTPATTPAMIPAPTAETMMAPLLYLLAVVGPGGLPLSAAGWMPPSVVSSMMRDLKWESRWYGTFTREDGTLPVRRLRQSAMQLGLLRRHKGRLLLGSLAKLFLDDPVALREYIVARIALRTPDTVEGIAARLLLVEIVSGAHRGRSDLAAAISWGLAATGWVVGNGDKVPLGHVSQLIAPTLELLEDVGVVSLQSSFPGDEAFSVQPGGLETARAILNFRP